MLPHVHQDYLAVRIRLKLTCRGDARDQIRRPVPRASQREATRSPVRAADGPTSSGYGLH